MKVFRLYKSSFEKITQGENVCLIVQIAERKLKKT